VGVSVTIVTVPVVIIVVLLVRLMMTYGASDRGARNAVMARHMAHKSANHRSFDASGSKR
jgi:hypothetical protein